MFENLGDKLYKALIADDRWRLYIDGLWVTLQIAVFACIIGIVIGLVVAVVKIYAKGSRNPFLWILNAIFNLYTTIIRGTPLVIQLLILYNIVLTRDGLLVSVISFGINSGAYVSEIFRAGINSVDAGQMEAGRSLGLSRNRTMWNIILPQGVKNILPPLFNEFIVLVKETSVAGYIAVNDLTKVGERVTNVSFNILPLIIAALVYLALTIILTQIQKVLERRLARSDRR